MGNIIINISEIVWVCWRGKNIQVGFKNGTEKVFEFDDEISASSEYRELNLKMNKETE